MGEKFATLHVEICIQNRTKKKQKKKQATLIMNFNMLWYTFLTENYRVISNLEQSMFFL